MHRRWGKNAIAYIKSPETKLRAMILCTNEEKSNNVYEWSTPTVIGGTIDSAVSQRRHKSPGK